MYSSYRCVSESPTVSLLGVVILPQPYSESWAPLCSHTQNMICAPYRRAEYYRVLYYYKLEDLQRNLRDQSHSVC